VSTVAILGAGPIGAAVAQRLAERGHLREVRLIDDVGSVAAGKALDIRQAGPIVRYDTVVTGHGDQLAATGADVVVVADSHAEGEWEGERGLAMLQRLVRAGYHGPCVFAGTKQTWLIEAAARELKIPADRLLGAAAGAMSSIARALLHIETGQTGSSVVVTGRPPRFVVAWSAATIGGQLVTSVVSSHRLLAITQSLQRFWPPGPQAIAAAAAPIVEGLIAGSRAHLPAAVLTDGEFGARGVAALMPVELGQARVQRREVPSLSPQEMTETANAIVTRISI
jgi:malate dehydrogenase